MTILKNAYIAIALKRSTSNTYRKNVKMKMEANIDKLKELNWSPKVSIKNGIEKIIKEDKN